MYCVDSYQNDIYFEKRMTSFALPIEFLPIYGKNFISSWLTAYGNMDGGNLSGPSLKQRKYMQ